ncbi:MAG TPA: ABC transporter substrate-binding protein [Tepidisphaeraceae bacterium]|nr:ABC transporter substrate-binding protein [Tepidisphaeraceae bacterium]
MTNHRHIFIAIILAAAMSCLQGCRRQSAVSADGRPKVKVCYIGLTCEAPIFVAYEKGFFKDEGLDVELVKTSWDSLLQGLSFGRFDATHTLVPYLLKPIEQGLEVKMTGGIHHGCLRIQAAAKSNIHSVEDLRGKRIAIATMGSPPMIFAYRVLAAHGMDVNKDVTWVVYPADSTELAMARGQVDAIADSEPIGSLLLSRGSVRTIADQSVDVPFKDEYCCAVVVSRQLAREHPATAAKVTRALLKGAKWVGVNPMAAARLSAEKKYLAATPELNAAALALLNYTPGVSTCQRTIVLQAQEMKKAGMLNASTDPADLAQRAWQKLDGVDDQWLSSLQVEKVPGQPDPPRGAAALAALMNGKKACCGKCCLGE